MSGFRSDSELPEGLGLPNGDAQSTAVALRRRPGASVTLRQRGVGAGESDDGDSGPSFDPATRSLADALRITYRLLLVFMVVLVVLYILSGFQSVKESERGIRLRFGKVQAKDLSSGFQFSLPQPFGELVKVGISTQTDDINSAFFPRLTEAEEKQIAERGVQSLADGGSDTLDPDADGQMLTADGNIVHARWSVTFQRQEPWKFAQNIDPDYEKHIVIAAARNGIVQAAATLTIDDILKKQAESASTQQGATSKIELRARENAQKVLDRVDSGIQITQLAMTTVIPPRRVMNQFASVQSAQAARSKDIEDARNARNDALTGAAGESAPLLLSLIDRYEQELVKKNVPAAADILTTIDKVMLREPVEIDGKTASHETFGQVSTILDDARQYRSSVVNRAKGDASLFEAKLELFRSNPLVMIHGDWSDAFRTFMTRDTVQAVWLPQGVAREILQINRDPTIVAEQIEARQLRENEEANKRRILEMERKRFEQRTDPATRTREQ